ncbi:hypothetical protein LCGC14_1275900 [marine sediment metagenome]|uniref:Uncharacterized protein n=2 Tax=marine sediment metagenome TaxID=412755 RepID=A0A0F9KYD8_9ZZZZ
MAGRVLNVARFPGGGIPDIQSMQYVASESIVKGSILIFESTGQVKLGASNLTTGIVGIALEAIASKPGFEPSHDSLTTVYTGRVAEVSVAMANSNTVFSGGYVTGEVPAIDHVGETHPLTLSAGVWQVGLATDATQSVRVVDVDVLEGIVFFKFLASAIV